MTIVYALLSAIMVGICSRTAWEYSAADGIMFNLMIMLVGIAMLVWEPHTTVVLVANTTILSWISFEKFWIGRWERQYHKRKPKP